MHYKIKELHRLITTLVNDEGLSKDGELLLEGYAARLEIVVKEKCNIGYVSGRFLKDLTIRMKNWGNLLKNKPIPKDEEITVNAYIEECSQIIKYIHGP